MSEIIIFKWYSPKKITQYLLLLGLAAGLMPIEKTQAASSVQLVQQQTVNVKGTVLDSHGEPVIGANVVVDNTTQGTITDIDGNFKLSVPMGAKLKISFIGYETQTVVVKNAKMSIVLADDSNVLDEVQIVAYGAQKKVTVTGAVSGVKGSDLLKTPTGSVTNVLSGQLTGITTVQYLSLIHI